MTPTVSLHQGINTATFHWPSVGISQNEENVFELVMRTKHGTFTVEKYQATFTISGVGIVAGEGRTEPRPMALVEWKPIHTEVKGSRNEVNVGLEFFTHTEFTVETSHKPVKYSQGFDSITTVERFFNL
jgi:hypothetical protein